MLSGGQQQFPGGLLATLGEFAEALQRSYRTTEALASCHQVFQELSNRELAEQNNHKMSVVHTSEYGTDDGQAYQDDNRSNGSQQPEKKLRRGVSGPIYPFTAFPGLTRSHFSPLDSELLLLAVATAATEQRPRNGAEVPMAPERCAMHVDCVRIPYIPNVWGRGGDPQTKFAADCSRLRQTYAKTQ